MIYSLPLSRAPSLSCSLSLARAKREKIRGWRVWVQAADSHRPPAPRFLPRPSFPCHPIRLYYSNTSVFVLSVRIERATETTWQLAPRIYKADISPPSSSTDGDCGDCSFTSLANLRHCHCLSLALLPVGLCRVDPKCACTAPASHYVAAFLLDNSKVETAVPQNLTGA